MTCGYNEKADLARWTRKKHIGGNLLGCDKWSRPIITFSNYTSVDLHPSPAPLPKGADKDKERELKER